ncbi:MAG: ATP-binding cassette subfamily B protein [Glaciecola sp.]
MTPPAQPAEKDIPGVLGEMPPELERRLGPLLEHEPAAEAGKVKFDRAETAANERFTLRVLIRGHAPAFVMGFVLVAMETIAMQAAPLFIQRAIDRGVLPGNTAEVVRASAMLIVSIVIGSTLTSIRLRWTGRTGQRLTDALRVRVFTQMQRLSQSFFTEERVGRLLTRMTSDITALTGLLQDGILNFVVQGFTLILVTAVLLSLNVKLALFVFVAVGPTTVAATLWFRRASTIAYAHRREQIAEVLTDLQENLAGAREVTATNRAVINARLHRRIVGKERDAGLRIAHITAIYAPGMNLVAATGLITIVLVGGQMVLSNQLTIGELTAFMIYLSAFFSPIQQLVNLYNVYQAGVAAVDKLDDLFAVLPEVSDSPHAYRLPPLKGLVVFEDVTFGYSRDRPVVSDVNLSISPGETIALVGETGAGKSTLAKLLTRTYDPQHGRIMIDGHDARRVQLASLRSQIGVVPQEPFLFSGSLRDNLRVGRPAALDAELARICEELGLGPLLRRLGGLSGRIAERGSTLSAGERQLIALGRALLTGPRLLVLDEATSNLDLRSELAVQRALDVVLTGRTAIIVAHRLSTARRADRVVVMSAGRVVEVGSHRELLASDGTYSAMYATWEASLS